MSQSPSGTSNADLHRDIGRLEGRLDSMERRQASFEEKITEALASLGAKIDDLSAFSSFGQGAWKMVTVFGAVAGTIILAAAGLITYAITQHDELNEARPIEIIVPSDIPSVREKDDDESE